VGVGHLGKEHARILSGLPGVELVGVVDARPAQAEVVAQRCGTRAFSNHQQLIPLVQAAVIAVPTAVHHEVACDFLEQGIPLLIEKPLAATLDQADDLLALAQRHGTWIQVGHIERFNPAFEELSGRPLQPKYVTCERCGGFSGRSTDVGVVLDMMIHDLDLVLSLVQSPVVDVDALGVAVLGGHEDLAQARVTFANGCIADLTASRVHPAVSRRMQVWAPEGYAGIDFAARHLTLMQPAARLLRNSFDSRRLSPDMLASIKNDLFGGYVQVLEKECSSGPADQLTRELQAFVESLHTGRRPRVDGVAGRDALALASRILDRLRTHAWEGTSNGPVGPHHLPARRGWLFTMPAQEAA
jgi:predicted dehydrogenase